MNGRPLRVFHLIKSLGRGGAEMLLADGPASSDPERFTYGFGYFLPHKRALVPELERRFGPVSLFPATNAAGMAAQVHRVARHLRAWRADLVHCHLPLAGVVGRMAGVLAGVPVVYTEHNVLERYHPATRWAARATWRWQRRVVAVSADVRESIIRNFGERVPVQVVRNGVTLERFSRDAASGALVRDRLGIPAGAPVVGSVAVFRKQKRLDLWMEVARRVSLRQPEARFLLVGDGPLRAEIEASVERLGLSERVFMPGIQEDVRPFLSAMDLYLMTSDFEGVPIALLEAMAMEVPPVVTDAGGIPEVIVSGRDGSVVPRGDVEALVDAVIRALSSDAATRASFGAAARARIADEFSTARMMREIESIYTDALSN